MHISGLGQESWNKSIRRVHFCYGLYLTMVFVELHVVVQEWTGHFYS